MSAEITIPKFYKSVRIIVLVQPSSDACDRVSLDFSIFIVYFGIKWNNILLNSGCFYTTIFILKMIMTKNNEAFIS